MVQFESGVAIIGSGRDGNGTGDWDLRHLLKGAASNPEFCLEKNNCGDRARPVSIN